MTTSKGFSIEHEGYARLATAYISCGACISRCMHVVNHTCSSAINIPPLSAPMNGSMVLLLLPHNARITADASTALHPASQQQSATSKSRAEKPEPATRNAITVAPELPKIDWAKEAELATQNAIADAAKENDYRNLSALSPEQLSWVRQNHLEPAAPGIAWKYRRVEITEGGLPIIHINDQCVAIPFLMMMVFCKIGHIEPNGDLFKHMRDQHIP
jgi:hypothetical protein